MAIFANPAKKCLIFTNLKVMYSTLKSHDNLIHLNLAYHTNKYTFARLLLRRIGRGPKTYLLVRNPYARIISFFRDKFRKDPYVKREKKLLASDGWERSQRIFFPYLGIDEDTRSPERVSRALESVTFEQVVELLPEVVEKDPHIKPQSDVENVFVWRNIPQKVVFDTVIPIETMDPSFMKRDLGVNLNVRVNSTGETSYKKYLSRTTLSVINRVYRLDFERFGYLKYDDVPSELLLSPTGYEKERV